MQMLIARPDGKTQGRLLRAIWLSIVAALVLAPLLASRIVVSTDGPSHVYNAFVQSSLRIDAQSPLAVAFVVDPGAPARGLFQPLVQFLGPRLGWFTAERLLAASTVLFLFLSLVWLLGATRLDLLLLAAWFASSWFVGMGFYDFAMSLVFFVLLLRIFREPPTAKRMLLANVLVLGAWLTHSFTLCASVAVFAAWWLSLRVHGTVMTSSLAWILPAVLLLFEALVLSGVGGSGYSWISVVRQVAGVVVSDHLVSFSRADMAAGITVTTLVLYGAWRGARLGLFSGPAGTVAVAGIVLTFLSIVAPDAIGDGSYIGTRLRILGALCILPVVASSLAHSRRGIRVASALVLGGSLAAHGVAVVRAAGLVERDLDAVISDLRALGARPQDSIDAQLEDWEYGQFRISGYLHLVDRAALQLRLISLRNYEADLSIFPVRWRTRPLRLAYRADGQVLRVDVAEPKGLLRRVFVVHDCSSKLASNYEMRTRCADRLGVTMIEPIPGN